MTQDTTRENDKTQLNITNESQEVKTFSADYEGRSINYDTNAPPYHRTAINSWKLW